MGGVQMEQPLYMGGKIRAAYKNVLAGQKKMAQNEMKNLTATEVIQKNRSGIRSGSKSKGDENSSRCIPRCIDGIKK